MTASGIEHATFRLLAQGESKYFEGRGGVGTIQSAVFLPQSYTDRGSNTDLRSRRPASDRLSHGAVLFFVKLLIVSKHKLVTWYEGKSEHNVSYFFFTK
jgi:hypothetical protein